MGNCEGGPLVISPHRWPPFCQITEGALQGEQLHTASSESVRRKVRKIKFCLLRVNADNQKDPVQWRAFFVIEEEMLGLHQAKNYW